MYMSPNGFSALATLAGEITTHADFLLDLAEREEDEQKARALVSRARELMTLSRKMLATLASEAQAAGAVQPSPLGASVRSLAEQLGISRVG